MTKILTDECSALINIPVPKTHRLTGFTGALKNHYGSINNPNKFHDNNCCNPGIPELNTLWPIKDKTRLIIGNALIALYNKGPRWDKEFTWNEGSLFFSTDPVAIDQAMMDLVEKKRKEKGMNSLTHQSKFLELSENLNLGKRNYDIVKLAV